MIREEVMSELFKKEDYLTDKEKASQVFSEAYRGMTNEIDRVASEEVTIWGLLTSWIYEKIFGKADHVKETRHNRYVSLRKSISQNGRSI